MSHVKQCDYWVIQICCNVRIDFHIHANSYYSKQEIAIFCHASMTESSFVLLSKNLIEISLSAQRATRAKRPKRPFCCPDGQRLPDGYPKGVGVENYVSLTRHCAWEMLPTLPTSRCGSRVKEALFLQFLRVYAKVDKAHYTQPTRDELHTSCAWPIAVCFIDYWLLTVKAYSASLTRRQQSIIHHTTPRRSVR